eukprot:scaffold35823_cov35-Phaeocystis_antarctica.AAC.1
MGDVADAIFFVKSGELVCHTVRLGLGLGGRARLPHGAVRARVRGESSCATRCGVGELVCHTVRLASPHPKAAARRRALSCRPTSHRVAPRCTALHGIPSRQAEVVSE